MIQKLTIRFIALAITLAFLFAPFVEGQKSSQRQTAGQQRAQQNINSARPRLVLLIAIDQFRYDYLERFGDLFAADGFNRLLRGGASWANCNYDHTPTETAPGHATMLTGAYPAQTGIIANEWYDRESGRRVTSVEDEATVLLDNRRGASEANNFPGASPKRLMASTLGDELRLASTDRAKVIGISAKDRAAILPAGHHANAAYWFDTRTGDMVSSSYYFPNQTLPAWVASFNYARFVDSFYGKSWERLLPEAEYLRHAGADAPAWEIVPNGRNTFPHPLKSANGNSPDASYYAAFYASPFCNEMLLKFAESAITNERLGQRGETDLLTVSFSSNDAIGHTYGAYSQELMDVTLRTDRTIAELLNFVDKNVGLQNTIVVLTADHGVAPTPEHAAALGLIAPHTGRIPSGEILQKIRQAFGAQFGGDEKTKDYLVNFSGVGDAGVFFNYAAMAHDHINTDEAARIACQAAMQEPGIAHCYTRAQLANAEVAAAVDPVARRVQHGFYPRRSADLIIVQEPFKLISASATGASHGTPYNYDTHVPLIIMSARLKPGIYQEAATPCDLAPTLAALLRVQPPSNAVGRVLIEAMK